MRLVLFAVLLGVSSLALADDECNVHVSKAPKRVRAAIEARVGIESACTALDVQVTKRGKTLVVTARSEGGESFRGEAPDEGRVAELVMAWAAPAEPVVEAPAAVPEEAEVEAASPVERITVVEPARHEHGRDIGVGVIASPIAYGIRAEVDALVWRGFALGVAFGASDAVWTTGDVMSGTTVDLRDLAGGAFVAKTFGTGAWRVRLQAGLGIVYTRYTAKSRTAPFERTMTGDGATRSFDAAIALSREINRGWAVQLGPLFQYYAQTFDVGAAGTQRTYDVGGYLSVKRRL